MATKTGFDAWVKRRSRTSAEFRSGLKDARAHIDCVDDVVRALDSARVDVGLSKAELARAIGVMPESIRRLFTSEAANPSLDTVMKLADALGLQLTLSPKPRRRR